ncbi:MAG: ABC transporter substrate-binding protein [Chloroflexi bacterium]|nr:ABC transporter substrate-binding protein [Chloroflexota bacterium]
MGSIRRIIVSLSIALALAAGCAAPSPTATPTTPAVAAPTPTKAPTATPTKRPLVKVSYVTSSVALSSTQHWVAEGLGYFQEEGLDLDTTLAGSGAKALTATASGDADWGGFNGGDLLPAIAQGLPIQVFAAIATRGIAPVVLRKDVADRLGITEKTGLEEKARLMKGLSFAASSPNSGTDLRMRYFLRLGGIDPERDVTITYIGSAAAMPAAIEIGSVDGGNVIEPDASVLIKKGTVILLANYADGKIPGTEALVEFVSVARKDKMEQRPEIYEAYVRAIWRAMDILKSDLTKAGEAARKARFSDLDPEVFNIAMKNSLPALALDPHLPKVNLDGQIAFSTKLTPNDPPPQVRYEDYYTDRFVQAAKKQLGK